MQIKSEVSYYLEGLYQGKIVLFLFEKSAIILVNDRIRQKLDRLMKMFIQIQSD